MLPPRHNNNDSLSHQNSMVDPLFETDVGAEPVSVDELASEGGEEALAERIVVTVADRSHGRAHAGLAAAGSESDRGVLRSLVGMVDDILRPALPERHVDSVEHDGQVEEPSPSRPKGPKFTV